MFCKSLFVLLYFSFVCSSSIYGFWLLLWYLLSIVLSVLLRYKVSDYSFGIFCLLCCLFFDIRFLITPLVSFVYCVVCSSSIYWFWWALWYLQTLLRMIDNIPTENYRLSNYPLQSKPTSQVFCFCEIMSQYCDILFFSSEFYMVFLSIV